MNNDQPQRFALCLNNVGYESALEVGKLYRVVANGEADHPGYLRLVDESGDDYLYDAERFHQMDLPEPVEQALILALA